MNNLRQDPFDMPYPPLDITMVARCIAHLWGQWVDRAEHAARQDLRILQAIDGGPGGELYFRISAMESGLGESIIEVLRNYDEGRTRHIELLKSQLMEMHMRMPAPSIIIPKSQE